MFGGVQIKLHISSHFQRILYNANKMQNLIIQKWSHKHLHFSVYYMKDKDVFSLIILNLVVCILLHVLHQVQGFRLT
jgi:hypothetical protein